METLREYRDDGPLAAALASLGGAGTGPLFVLVAGVVPLVAALAIERDTGAWVGAALLWYVLIAARGAGRAHIGRLDWILPVILRAAEYGAVVAMVALSNPGALPGAYLALFGVSVHHYEIVYRIRHLQVAPPRWVGWAVGGWEIRLLAVYALARADALSPALAVVGAYAMALFVAESTATWMRVVRAESR